MAPHASAPASLPTPSTSALAATRVLGWHMRRRRCGPVWRGTATYLLEDVVRARWALGAGGGRGGGRPPRQRLPAMEQADAASVREGEG
eukprot:3680413-Prymnesium_polylepis.2